MEELKPRGEWQGAARPMSAAELSTLRTGTLAGPQSRHGPGAFEDSRVTGSGQELPSRHLRSAASGEPASRNGEERDRVDPVRLSRSTEGVFEPLWSSEGILERESEGAPPPQGHAFLGDNAAPRLLEPHSTKGTAKARAAAGGEGGSPGSTGAGLGPFARLYELAWVLIVITGSGFLYLLGSSVHAPSVTLPLPSLNPSQFPDTLAHPRSAAGNTASLMAPTKGLGMPSASGDLLIGIAGQGLEHEIPEGGTMAGAGADGNAVGAGSGAEGAGAERGVLLSNSGGPALSAESEETTRKLFHDDYLLARRRRPLSAKCDLWTGRWVYDPSYPLWPVGSCHVGMNGSGCTELGRKDTDFMRFRWQPDGCTLPRFSAKRMRRKLRGKRVVFLGDSLGRNQLQSLLCMLASDLPRPQRTVEEISGASKRPKLDWRVFKFHGFNFTLEYYVSHFLVLHRSVPRHIKDAPKKVWTVVDTESMDWNVGPLLRDSLALGLSNDHNMILVVNAGHWYNRAKLFDKGAYFLAPGGQSVNTSISIPEGFEAAMRTVAAWLQTLKKEHGVVSLWRGYSPIHFVGGSWNSGGHCEVRWPLQGQASPSLLRLHRSQSQGQSADSGAANGSQGAHTGGAPGGAGFVDETGAMAEAAMRVMEAAGVPVLDIWPLSHMRPDGHPAKYYNWGNPTVQDCSHWCLPGVPDTWNELLLAHLTAHKLL